MTLPTAFLVNNLAAALQMFGPVRDWVCARCWQCDCCSARELLPRMTGVRCCSSCSRTQVPDEPYILQAFNASGNTAVVQQHIQWGLAWLTKAHTNSSAAAASNVLVGQVSASTRAAGCLRQLCSPGLALGLALAV
jgi:hypothetical protein